MKPKIIIVDKDDNVIGYKERGVLKREDIYRVSALWLTNSKGGILLARRHRTKTHHPLKWGPAVAGTVDEGETYDSNIIKETEEELGLKDIKPTKGPKVFGKGTWIHFTQWYTLSLDKEASEFKIQEDEVEEVRWFTKEELVERSASNPEEFIDSIKKAIELFVM
jgi:isopentenyl-diphosphate delta-isomerase